MDNNIGSWAVTRVISQLCRLTTQAYFAAIGVEVKEDQGVTKVGRPTKYVRTKYYYKLNGAFKYFNEKSPVKRKK